MSLKVEATQSYYFSMKRRIGRQQQAGHKKVGTRLIHRIVDKPEKPRSVMTSSGVPGIT
jgi:hypothetical protein